MDERKKAGAKAGTICLVLLFVVSFLDSSLSLVVGWICYLLPGILAVRFGKDVIKNGKDAAISISIASTVTALCIVFILPLLIYGSLFYLFVDVIIVFPIILLFVLLFSLVSGMVYAKYGLKLFTQGTIKSSPPKRLKPPSIPHCPVCGTRIERSWALCPHCGVHLEGEKGIHDDDTRVYDNGTKAYDDETKAY